MTDLSTTQTNTFDYTGKIETVTVEMAGYYDIAADGAQGGEGDLRRRRAWRHGERRCLSGRRRRARDRRRRRGRGIDMMAPAAAAAAS